MCQSFVFHVISAAVWVLLKIFFLSIVIKVNDNKPKGKFNTNFYTI